MKQVVYYVSNTKPLSHNKGGTKEEYKEIHSARFQQRYAHLYTGLPLEEEKLHSSVVYIHHNLQKGTTPDIDNLSKPIVDAFSGVIYVDDEQITQREANRFELDDLQFITIDYSMMPHEVATDLNEFISNQEQHIILFSVNSIELKDIKIGEI